MDKKVQQDEIVRIVESDEAKDLYVNTLRTIDQEALKKNGKIKKYRIDYKSIHLTPMGFIGVTLIINDNPKMKVKLGMSKSSGKLETGLAYS